ncbi:glycoside hydrolase family 127 protein [Roseateles sp.]|uniref:glycoside hydrolase family 127 protein n=1 Tax=Roseateles sp. TaxID=1971397 RepID=UPI003BAA2E25
MNTTVQLGGLLGEAIEASRRGRLHHFIAGPDSPAIALFLRAVADQNLEGDWYGEHAGKWLVAASRAAARSGDAELATNVRAVADFLCAQQEADGYLGTYAPPRRFTVKQAPKPLTWDGAPTLRTWDIWTHSYLILGLIEAHRQFGEPRWLQAACRIGDLCAQALTEGGIDITTLGNHHGMSATVLLDAACELHFVTGEPRYLALAELILRQADRHAPLALLSRALDGTDAAYIATGKAYQLIWNLVGLAKLHRATGRPELLQAVQALWHNIREQHLSLGGGPWGGVAHRSREVFNAPGSFVPQAYVETCSTLAWVQLNRELLLISGDARYAEEIERTAYNDLLGAIAPNGEDWCYYSFPNGRRVHTTYWRCCKSSGAMALEELPALAVSGREGELSVHLYAPLTAQVGDVGLHVQTGYPYDGDVALSLALPRPAHFTLKLRCPAWAEGAFATVGGKRFDGVPGCYLAIERDWQPGDTVQLHLPLRVALHERRHRNAQESRAPDGSAVHQTVLDLGYAALTRGPLVFATGLIDGFKTDETVKLPEAPLDQWVSEVPGQAVPTLRVALGYRAPLDFQPYFLAGGQEDGSWRLTWLSTAPTPA